MLPLELTGAGLLLRPWRPADAPAVVVAFADPDVALWNPNPHGTMDLDGALEWIAVRGDWSGGDHASFAITEDDRLLGSVSLHRINPQMQDAAVGYWVLPAARGRGVAARAVRVVTAWGFEALDLHRIELCHAVGNVASCRVAAKAGFALEGTLRQAYRYGDGRRHDEHLHARLSSDPALPGAPDSLVVPAVVR